MCWTGCVASSRGRPRPGVGSCCKSASQGSSLVAGERAGGLRDILVRQTGLWKIMASDARLNHGDPKEGDMAGDSPVKCLSQAQERPSEGPSISMGAGGEKKGGRPRAR